MQPKKTPRKTAPPQDNPDQSKAFIEKAKEIGADEEHSSADKLMERLAKTKPEPHAKGARAKGSRHQ